MYYTLIKAKSQPKKHLICHGKSLILLHFQSFFGFGLRFGLRFGEI